MGEYIKETAEKIKLANTDEERQQIIAEAIVHSVYNPCVRNIAARMVGLGGCNGSLPYIACK